VRTESLRIQNFIDGQFVEPTGGKYLDNIEPATGEPYSQVADSDARDVDLAVAGAEKAFLDWSKKPAAERSRFLLRIADLIERDPETFARAESIHTGKPLTLARTLDNSARDRKFPILRDGNSAHRIGSAHYGQRRVQLHVASATRYRGTDFPVESPALFAESANRWGLTCIMKYGTNHSLIILERKAKRSVCF
jgi:hypothetical protein